MIPETDLYAAAFFLADHASVENGKVYVNGGFWNQMQFPTFPAASNFSVVAVINVPWSAQNAQHAFSVVFLDADANKLDGEFSGQFEVNPNPAGGVGDPFLMPIVAAANGFIFPSPGHYSAILQIDGEEIDRWGFRVNQLPPDGGLGGGSGPPDIPNF